MRTRRDKWALTSNICYAKDSDGTALNNAAMVGKDWRSVLVNAARRSLRTLTVGHRMSAIAVGRTWLRIR